MQEIRGKNKAIVALLSVVLLLGILCYTQRLKVAEKTIYSDILADELIDAHAEINQLEYTIKLLENDIAALESDNKNLRNDVIELELYIDELLDGFDKATITKYAPLDGVEGMDYEGDPNITATGSQVRDGVVAVDPKRIPYGTKLLIQGFDGVFTAEDTGSAMRNAEGLHIDVFTLWRDNALQFGRQERRIFIIGGE